MFSSLRGLKCQQTRYQDDIESLMYLAYYMIWGNVPWELDYNQVKHVHQMSADKQITLYKRFRQENAVVYNMTIIEKFKTILTNQQYSRESNPWFCIFSHI